MKDSEIYRRAAELIAIGEEDYACNSIEVVCRKESKYSWAEVYAIVSPFQNTMRPNKLPKDHWRSGWYGHPIDAYDTRITERQNCRVLALCFMAAIAESEGR